MYPADEMTMKEVKIACYAAQNILDRLENGAMIQRWQISAIVKAKEELASVYTSMSADDEEDDEWEDEYDEEPMYVGFEYPSMYGEEVEQLSENPWNQRLQKKPGTEELPAPPKGSVEKHGRKFKEGDTVVPHTGPHAGVPHKVTHARAGTVNILPMVPVNKHKYDNTTIRAKHEHLSPYKEPVKEEADFKVTVDGLPDMYVKADSPSEVKNNLRKVVKNPEMIKGVERIAKASLQKMFRDKAAGKEVMEETDLEEADGTKRNRELLATGRISKDEFDKRMGYGKYKTKDNSKKLDGPGGLYKNLVKRIGEETDLEEGYNDPIHRKYISDTVHDYVTKDDPKHDKIVDHLHKAKNFGSKTVDSLSDHAGISLGAANAITKEVASNLKANFGTPQKTQTQAQRVGAYLKQKHIGPRSK